ncbi:MAG: PadR family transcriptional regulator [candidate division NC10 bacterium]|nr:PadR family transcriptional regulator [candidate division NC10 bacterium]
MLRDLFLGFIRIHILFHASEAPVFGVALMAELARHGYRVGPGTLYPVLHSLERQGYLRQDGQVVNGKVRKYYHLTPAGRRTLRRAQGQLHELVGEVLPGAGSAEAQRPQRGHRGPR